MIRDHFHLNRRS